jgi:hypothetical protein
MKQGKRIKELPMPSEVVAFEPFVFAARNIYGWMVSMANREVRLYVRDTLISSFEVEVVIYS